jgi:hypothetical protein
VTEQIIPCNKAVIIVKSHRKAWPRALTFFAHSRSPGMDLRDSRKGSSDQCDTAQACVPEVPKTRTLNVALSLGPSCRRTIGARNLSEDRADYLKNPEPYE